MRKRRTEVNIELRKQKKEEHLLKKRNIDTERDLSLSPQREALTKHDFEEMRNGFANSDPKVQFVACQTARKILSRERNPPIDLFLQEGLIPSLVSFLSQDDNPGLQFESAWAITNIASGSSDHTQAVVRENCLPPLVRLLSSPHANICEQAVWALGNIAGDSSALRDFVLAHGVVAQLVKLVTHANDLNFLRNLTWTLSNLCRNKNPLPDMEYMKPLLPCLATLIHHSDMEIVADACWAISYLTDGPNDRIQAVLDTGVIPRLSEILHSHPNDLNLLSPSLRALGNIITGTEVQTQAVIDAGALRAIGPLMCHPKINIQKEATWFLSNVAAGSPSQVEALFAHDLIGPLLMVLTKSDYKCQKEAAWAVNNLAASGTPEHVLILIHSGVVPPMCDLLKSHEPRILMVLLESLNIILETAKSVNDLDRVALLIEECGGLDRIEMLQEHENEDVYKAALKIVDNYYSEGDGWREL
ncbi:KPNA2 [Cordylochernes scorpioides]|uniref:Importin subunit alpha n=1 Tax=Cordylochernes scorpioides TaxID=51811 RepID=A0ABY6LHI0_9ARAC|nr:KPNA2 [Cordylochernes scorpioides]